MGAGMNNIKSFEQIEKELNSISPLALPHFLLECEHSDCRLAQEIIDEAIEEFEDNGGLAGNLVEPVLSSTTQSVFLILLKKFHKSSYDKARSGKIDISRVGKEILQFKYPDHPKDNVEFDVHDINQEVFHNNQKMNESGISSDYKRAQEWDNTSRKKEYKKDQIETKGVGEDVVGRKTYISEAQASEKGSSSPNKDLTTTDHICSLARIHGQFGSFSRRYSNQENMNKIVNSDENYQLLNRSSNSSKGDKTAAEWITKLKHRREAIKKEIANKDLSPEKKAEYKEELERKDQAIKAESKLLQNEKDAEEHLSKELRKEGAKTVGLEQIGKIVETLIGPLSFEVKDMIKNGICHGFSSDDILECLWKRICRAGAYIIKELPRLLGDFFGDLGQMLVHLAMSVFGIIKDFFGKFLDIIVQGLSTIKEAVKILVSSGSGVQKADAISKLLVTFATGILGQFLIDKALNSLGIPDPFSEIAAMAISTMLSTLVIYFFNKADIFNVQSQVRHQRVKEILQTKTAEIKKNSIKLDMLVTQKMKEQRLKFEKIKHLMNVGLSDKDWDSVNSAADEFAKFLHVQIPYSSSIEFVKMIKRGEPIHINSTF